MAEGPIRQHKAFAMGSKTPGYGHESVTGGGRNPGYATGGSVKHGKSGAIGHKSHGHGLGKAGGVGVGGAPIGKSQPTSGSSGPSATQFGPKMPSGKGSSLGRW